MAGPSRPCSQPQAPVRLGRQRPTGRPGPSAGRRASHVCLDGKLYTPSPLWDEVVERDGFRVYSPKSAEPDYDDPDWIDKVDDWNDFWNYTNWNEEVEDMDTEDGYVSTSRENLHRARQLIKAFDDLDRRSDIINWMGGMEGEDSFEEDKWANPPSQAERLNPNPPLSDVDVRAMAEKRHQRMLMDAEWRRQQALVGTITYEHNSVQHDVRVRRQRENGQPEYRFDWSDEDVYKLITQDGMACAPENHKGKVENPFLIQDYHNDHGVRHIEDTEEFLDRIGHLASTDMRLQFDREFIIHGDMDISAEEFGAVDSDDDDENHYTAEAEEFVQGLYSQMIPADEDEDAGDGDEDEDGALADAEEGEDEDESGAA